MANNKPQRDTNSDKKSDVDELLSEYPEIGKHMSDFRVSDPDCGPSFSRPRHFKDSIVVFKKKRLLSHGLHSNINIYEYSQNLELDLHDQRKSRTSCQRCRRYKKKCTRDLPECLNCVSCEEMCYYPKRKKKRRDPSAASHIHNVPRRTQSHSPRTCYSGAVDHASDVESACLAVSSEGSLLSPNLRGPQSPKKESSIHWLLN